MSGKQITIDKIGTISTKALKKEFARSLDITAKHLEYLATIWSELENRGEDLSDFRHGLMGYLPLISSNRMNANLVIKYAGHKTLLSAIARLPIDQQDELAKSGFVTVMTATGDTFAEIQTPLDKLPASEINAVFGETSIRTPAKQVEMMTRKPKKKPASRPRMTRKVSLNKDKSVKVGSSSVSVEKLLPILSSYYDFDVRELLENHKNQLKMKNQP